MSKLLLILALFLAPIFSSVPAVACGPDEVCDDGADGSSRHDNDEPDDRQRDDDRSGADPDGSGRDTDF